MPRSRRRTDLDLDVVELQPVLGVVAAAARSSRRAAPLPVERRVGADADRGGVALAGVQPPQPPGVHAVGGRRRRPPRAGTLAVGKPSSRPRWSPRTTTPRTVTGRPSASAAPATSPAARQVRTYVDDHTCGPPSSGTPSVDEVALSAPAAVRVATSPAARWPNRKLAPTTTAPACSSVDQDRSTNSSGDQPAISRVNGRTSTASAPASPSSAARSSIVVSVTGACSGRSTAIGCGSNVTATTIEAPLVGHLPARAITFGARGGRRRSCR